jgi:hypothetical protein
MATFYLDTSALVKYYHTESGSAWLGEQIDARASNGQPLHTIFISEIAIAEAAAAFAILARTQQVEIALRDAMLRDLRRDTVIRYQTVTLTRAYIEAAADLTQRYPLKGYDAIQLASALAVQNTLREFAVALIFVASDKQLLQAAQAESLLTENPQDDSA